MSIFGPTKHVRNIQISKLTKINYFILRQSLVFNILVWNRTKKKFWKIEVQIFQMVLCIVKGPFEVDESIQIMYKPKTFFFVLELATQNIIQNRGRSVEKIR